MDGGVWREGGLDGRDVVRGGCEGDGVVGPLL